MDRGMKWNMDETQIITWVESYLGLTEAWTGRNLKYKSKDGLKIELTDYLEYDTKHGLKYDLKCELEHADSSRIFTIHSVPLA